jgi:hypothetical protein
LLNIYRLKEKKLGEENESLSANEIKRKELLKLKSTIDQNREIFQARINKKKYMDAKKNEELLEERRQILERGENPEFFIPRKLKLEEYERSKK